MRFFKKNSDFFQKSRHFFIHLGLGMPQMHFFDLKFPFITLLKPPQKAVALKSFFFFFSHSSLNEFYKLYDGNNAKA